MEISDGVGVLLKITAVCNAGLLLEYEKHCILIDGTAYDYLGFTGIDDRLLSSISDGTFSDSKLCGILATHCHPDHFHASRTVSLCSHSPERICFFPDQFTPASGCIQCGPFSVYYYETDHMPHTYEQVRHYAMLVSVGGESVYIAGDAKLDSSMHRNILQGHRPTYVVVNPVYLTSADTIQLLSDLSPEKIMIYHIPADPLDRSGMRRKAERSMARCSDRLPSMSLADVFPKRLL